MEQNDEIDDPLDKITNVLLEEDWKSVEEMSRSLQIFLKPLKDSILSKIDPKKDENKQGPFSTSQVPTILMQSLCQLIWDPNLFYTEKGFLTRIYSQLNFTSFNETNRQHQSDFQDWMDYKPTEVMGNKIAQLFITLIQPNPKLFLEELENFQGLLQDNRIVRDGRAEFGYRWVYKLFSKLYNILANQQDSQENAQNNDDEEIDFHKLPHPSQIVIHGISISFAKLCKIKSQEKVKRMEKIIHSDPSSVEWCLILGEIYRLRRRDSGSRNKWATPEEMSLLESALSIAPENPFVRLAILDTIIGSVRDSSGRFHCGDIHLDNMDDSMRYLVENCIRLTLDFPNNVYILSVVSDYFARYFPHSYFDPDRGLAMLEDAYTWNPNNPKTTHRFGILYRMSYGDVEESLAWLAKTISLDPTHFQGTLEYYKTLLGKFHTTPNLPEVMESTLNVHGRDGAWNDYEMAEYLFYLGIAHFMGGNKEKCLFYWTECSKYGETMFTLEDMLTTSENFQWDHKLMNIDKIKLWIQTERNELPPSPPPFQEEQPKPAKSPYYNPMKHLKVSQNLDSEAYIEATMPKDLILSSDAKKVLISRLFSIMIGFGPIPKRPKNRDPFPSAFPPKFYNHFIPE